jgi:XTP/dITP diphosphohydrolase
VAIADDTGLEVAALDGAPGVISARYAGPTPATRTTWRTAVRTWRPHRPERTVSDGDRVVDPSGDEWTAEGVVEGTIVREPRGRYGFGYDPVFEVDGRTLGEMTPSSRSPR